ncbi:hypothetical protein BN946_scf184847.g17 [Trametes cinnabarina]|uniref:Uncharacterized protein n=1 Tax=Pycnoporus cinnabarinus TaxID=5643 RepID=A0A060SR63_PYCCI|nr:hypothetical protein BN946_scf184847.g17 [Trametes cinnabarina]
MVASIFILTRAFAISAMFVGAFRMTHAAPVPSSVTKSISPRWCRQVGCLYALPEGSTSEANSSASSSPLASPSSDASSSTLQVIDILISALQSAASTLREQSSTSLAPPDTSTVDSTIPTDVDYPASVEDGTLAPVIGEVADAMVSEDATDSAVPTTPTDDPLSTPEPVPPSTATEDAAPSPAVEVVGYSTEVNDRPSV